MFTINLYITFFIRRTTNSELGIFQKSIQTACIELAEEAIKRQFGTKATRILGRSGFVLIEDMT